MMSLIDLDDDQRWVPTHVNVTVLRARGLRTKGKHGSRYLYTIIHVGKEKFTTGLVEKAAVPEWNEECCFELLPGILESGGRGAYPPGSGDLVLTVMHRVLIGLDVFLGQAVVPLDKMFHDGMCPRDEWLKLNSKAGRKEKERGELQVTVQFTRNNMTASMFDLTMKDKPRSTFGKLKDRVTGRKRADMESSSAIVPGRYAALSGNLGQSFEDRGGGGLGGGVESGDTEVAEEKRSKMKDFFKGKLRRSSDTKSCSSLASESSVSSVASDNPGPPPSLDLLADPPTSPIYSSKVKVDTHYGETDLAKKVLTTQHNTKIMTHKRAFSDGASKVTTSLPRSYPAVETLKGQTMTQSKSSLCINGSHVYDSEPSTPKSTGALPVKLVLLEKCSPLSRSLQNLTKRSEDRGSPGEGRRWSFDKVKKEEKDEEKEAEPAAPQLRSAQATVQEAAPILSSAAVSPDKGKKLRKTLFSGGRSDSLPAKTESGQASEGRLRGWFGSSDSHNKPRLEVSPKVESSSDAPPPLPPRSPIPPQCSSPSAVPTGHVSPDRGNHTNPFTPSSSPSPTPLSPSNPFLPRMQRNPFFEELITENLCRSPPLVPRSPSVSTHLHYTASASQPRAPSSACDAMQREAVSIRRDRPRPVARQISLPTLLPRTATSSSPDHSTPRSMSDSAGEWDDSFGAFASSRLNSPRGTTPQKALRTTATAPRTSNTLPVDNHAMNPIEESSGSEVDPPPLPPRRLLRTPVNEIHSDSWLHRGQELAVHKEACLLSQAGVASLQRAREGERKRNTPSISPDPHTTSNASESLTQPCASITSPVFISEDKLKKFKYEPLEDESDFWKGMLFEQDLYGTVASGNYGEPKVNNALLSLASEETVKSKITSKSIAHCQQADVVEPKMLLDSKMSVSDMLSMSSSNPSETNTMSFDSVSTKLESTADSSLIKPGQPTDVDNNISSSLTLEDLNMNVHNSDFTFIDSDGSSPSEVVDTLKCLKGLGGILPKPSEDSPIAVDHEVMTTPEDMFTLTNTSIPESSSSFEMMTSTHELCTVSPLCQDNCQDNGCDLNNVAPYGKLTLNKKDTPENQVSYQPDLETEARQDITRKIENFKSTQALDDNGNPQAKQATPEKQQSPRRVVSVRLKRKGVTQNHCDGGSYGQTNMEQKKCDPLASTVQKISDTSEGPFSYQPTKSPMSNKRTTLITESLNRERVDHNESNTKSLMSSKGDTGSIQSKCSESCVIENPSKQTEMSFEDLHAKVAPNLRTASKSKISLPLQESKPCASILPPALSPPAAANSQAKQHPTPVLSPSMHPPTGISAAVAPYTSSSSSSSSSFSTSAQPPVDARHTLLPEETQPASNLPHQESSPHPVKPLTTTANQAEKKDGRSVLEKLKSTIHPGRAAQHSVVEAEKSQVARVDTSAQYQHLTNMELISLLLQQEVDMEEQQASCDQQGALLAKREADLKKVKNQVRDLEDYIDNLLLRIMEQTPTLLQVRGRHK